ncbi:LON peptidase substrate-binding domain-containing protein [Parahaliea mediterranea]|uniref:LON peptidase substrate-binding domain-containing protein n=1 Tax=Parahaliea mediterranea TaxID=651086 RepID=A0A939IKT2_9GAMM|nr:LON peptidase substrate-binding domain-containing protein [Parahaliea mediterranea]MBN7795765.1 LON peptidase substrate-binding domain-containing protein [Parahaliea mediterranea]
MTDSVDTPETSEIPLFPLSGVLLPWGRMPLRIFERRYLDLVRDCMRRDSGFGVVWIRRGEEVAQRGQASPELGDWGTYARIVDWDQLKDGLLGITIEGRQRFGLHATRVADGGLVMGEVSLEPPPAPAPVQADWGALVEVLQSLETHPHVQRMGLSIDYDNAWQVCYALAQLLPLEESLKYSLLGLDELPQLVAALNEVLNRISGED